MKSSVVSYPDRGHYGNNRYRGNCTGHIIRDFIQQFQTKKDGLIVDPSIGGGTFMDVCRELGVRHKGLDLHQGFNLLTNDLKLVVGEECHMAWWHPPYWDIIHYSGDQWGEEPNPWDMSRMSLEDFNESLMLAIANINDAVEVGGTYGILMGNVRKNGVYYNLSSLVERVAPSPLIDEIIKIQHNCVSDGRDYKGKLVRIAHEKLLVFRKARPSSALINLMQHRSLKVVSASWRVVVRRAAMSLGGERLSLQDLYSHVQPYAEATGYKFWKEKIRQMVQDQRYYQRVDKGVYTLVQ